MKSRRAVQISISALDQPVDIIGIGRRIAEDMHIGHLSVWRKSENSSGGRGTVEVCLVNGRSSVEVPINPSDQACIRETRHSHARPKRMNELKNLLRSRVFNEAKSHNYQQSGSYCMCQIRPQNLTRKGPRIV